MPLNIEFCLGLKIDLKHNSVASVLLPSSSRGFQKKRKESLNWLKAEQRARARRRLSEAADPAAALPAALQGWERDLQKETL